MGEINNRAIGKQHEDYACEYLISKGYKIIDRNWHWSNRGEIDIVAIDPTRFGEEYLIFVEVKFRDYSMESSLYALSKSKINQLNTLAKVYMQFRKINVHATNISFDFIAIHGKQIEHIKNII